MLDAITTLDFAYTLASVAGSLGLLFLTGLPMYFKWRKDSESRERTQFIVWDEIIGHPADPDHGIAAKPALATRVEQTLDEISKVSEHVTAMRDDQKLLEQIVTDHIKWSHGESTRLAELVRRHERKFHR